MLYSYQQQLPLFILAINKFTLLFLFCQSVSFIFGICLYTIKVKELCNKAELNRTTFYKYYENIYDVLADVEYDVLKDSEHCISEIENINESQIKNTIYKLLCNIQRNKDVYYLLLINSADNKFYEKLMKTTIDLLKNKIGQANIDLKENYEYILSL